MPEAITAQRELAQLGPAPGLLVVTSPDQLMRQWCAATRTHNSDSQRKTPTSHLLDSLPPNTTLVTILDGHPLTLAWLGGEVGLRVLPLGVSKFGMSGYLNEVYREQGINAAAIVDAVLRDTGQTSVTH
jgi:pyruvate dehydrogenase E1 component